MSLHLGSVREVLASLNWGLEVGVARNTSFRARAVGQNRPVTSPSDRYIALDRYGTSDVC